MNGTRWTRLAKTYLLDPMEGYRVRGRLLFASPIQDVLCAFSAEPSAFSDARFTVQAFTQPLYVPARTLIFSVGGRLGTLRGGAEHWWDLGSMDEAVILDDVRKHIDDEGLPFLASVRDPRGVARHIEQQGAGERDVNYSEWEAYSRVLIDDIDAARRCLVRTIDLGKSAPENLGWPREIARRANLIGTALESSVQAAREILWQWRGETLRALRLTEFAAPVNG